MLIADVNVESLYGGAVVVSTVIVGIAVGLVVVLFKTISAQKEYIKVLEAGKKRIENELKEEKETSRVLHEESKAEIRHLNSRLDAIRDVPLAAIAADMKSVAETNKQILARLDNSAETLAKTETKKTIETKEVSTTLAATQPVTA